MQAIDNKLCCAGMPSSGMRWLQLVQTELRTHRSMRTVAQKAKNLVNETSWNHLHDVSNQSVTAVLWSQHSKIFKVQLVAAWHLPHRRRFLSLYFLISGETRARCAAQEARVRDSR